MSLISVGMRSASDLAVLAGLPRLASLNTALAIAVPLQLQGLWLAHQRHGSLPWAQLLAPIIPLARYGFPAHPYVASSLASHAIECASALAHS